MPLDRSEGRRTQQCEISRSAEAPGGAPLPCGAVLRAAVAPKPALRDGALGREDLALLHTMPCDCLGYAPGRFELSYNPFLFVIPAKAGSQPLRVYAAK
jgi:hypothetical protein